MNKKKIQSFLKKMFNVFSKLKNREKTYTTWQCPDCLEDNGAPIPVNVECIGYRYGAKSCHKCDKLWLVKVYLDGETEVKSLNK